MVVYGEKNHKKGGTCGEAMLAGMAMLAEMAAPTEMAMLAEHRTSQRTQTSQHPGQPIAMSEKSSNFAPQFKITARSSHSHRVTIAHTGLCSRYAAFQ